MSKYHVYIINLIGGLLVTSSNIWASPQAFYSSDINHPYTEWEIIENTEENDWGHIRLYNNKWLMCFLHWKPIPEEDLDLDYVRNLLLTFWGTNMNYFSLTGDEGETLINGHEAIYVNGKFRDVVDTRFIVWNCEISNRQFIADLNINKKLNTPDTYMEMQEEIIKTIACHTPSENMSGSYLSKKYYNPNLGLSFFTPDNWKTGVFNAPEWYPEGVNHFKGSLWSLVKNSEMQLDLFWEKTPVGITEDMIVNYFNRIQNEEALILDHIEINEIINQKGFWTFSGSFILKKSIRYQEKYNPFSDKHQYMGSAWKQNDTVFFLVASVIDIETVWSREVFLTPQRSTIEKILSDAIILVGNFFKDNDIFPGLIFRSK